ncbi:hypothetical protein CRG98_039961 [Punica granatum]|uniref:Uncharacterized protein n=1 Tax=Punica granatum TaxID=22663 RepID=A0A2I0I6K3_PUNGR|nr:hypothetical protein CRG98_039961 [Punica granatum]
MDPSSDCIGSAFNSKRVMECPNCREVEAGQWRFSEVRPMPAPRRLGEALEEMREAASDMVTQRAPNNRVLYPVPSHYLRPACWN